MPTYRVDTPRFMDGHLCGPNTKFETVTLDKKLNPCPKGMVLLSESSVAKPRVSVKKKPLVKKVSKAQKPKAPVTPKALTSASVKTPVLPIEKA